MKLSKIPRKIFDLADGTAMIVLDGSMIDKNLTGLSESDTGVIASLAIKKDLSDQEINNLLDNLEREIKRNI